MVNHDTIFAEATVAGRAGVSVVRVSGPNAFKVCERLSGSVPRPRHAALRRLKRADGLILDQALVIAFPGPGSFTGEDVVELQLHGSIAVVSAVLGEIGKVSDCRIAEPGEFTRRSLQNGKMDLTQVEGLADLIEAQTEAQRRQAQTIFSGAFRSLVDDLRNSLIRAAALLEAVIDFADEEVPEDVSDEVVTLLDSCMEIMRKEIDGQRFAERVRTGFEIAIVGAPNSGKSTLLNRLAGRDVAITSIHAGTTRDIIEVQMDLDGVPVTMLDTAGLREADDPVEQIGVERARARAEASDIRVFLVDESGAQVKGFVRGDVVLRCKADLLDNPEDGVSGLTGFGIDRLIKNLTSELRDRVACAGLVTRSRHLQAFERSIGSLRSARDIVLGGTSEYDIAAEEIRSSQRALDAVIGRVDVENLLDVIFASFCVGK
jgi:tRNA modification GTPase